MSSVDTRDGMCTNVRERVADLQKKVAYWEAVPRRLDEITAHIGRTGVLRFSHNDELTFGQVGLSIRSYFKELCREHDRPYIIVQDGTKFYEDVSYLQIPRGRKMENFVASVTLVTEEQVRWNPWGQYSKAVRVQEGGWHYYFTGDGRAILNDLLAAWQQDPVYRIVMKLNRNPK